MRLSSVCNAASASLMNLRADTATLRISCTLPRATAPRMASPYGGTGPDSGRASFEADLLGLAGFLDFEVGISLLHVICLLAGCKFRESLRID
jgi:hypothetical protein